METIGRLLDFSIFWRYRAFLFSGLLVNLEVFALSALIAVTAGLPLALLRISRAPAVRGSATAFVELMRNAPEYVLMMWVHLVLPLLLAWLLGWRLRLSPFTSAVLALGLAYSGFFAETFRAGIQSVARGQLEAARAIGMSRWLGFRRIILPQALRRTLPETLNNAIALFKTTTLVSLLTVDDLMYRISVVIQSEMNPMPLYTGAALLYFAIIFAATTGVERLTRTWQARGRA